MFPPVLSCSSARPAAPAAVGSRTRPGLNPISPPHQDLGEPATPETWNLTSWEGPGPEQGKVLQYLNTELQMTLTVPVWSSVVNISVDHTSVNQ